MLSTYILMLHYVPHLADLPVGVCGHTEPAHPLWTAAGHPLAVEDPPTHRHRPHLVTGVNINIEEL